MRPRKSTAILIAAWIATFVLYIFVKPDDTESAPTTLLNTIPAAVITGKTDR